MSNTGNDTSACNRRDFRHDRDDQTLIDKGHAYAAEDGTVYYRTRSFPDMENSPIKI